MSLMLRQQFTDLFVSRLPFLNQIIFEQFDAPSLTYTQVFDVVDSSRAYEEITGITGLGLFDEKPEGEVVTYDMLLQGYDKRYTHKSYAKACQISREAISDDIDNAISNVMPPLARSARVSIETEAFSDFNNGFGTVTTPDGVSFFHASHPLVGGGTSSNLVSADFSQGALETAINLYDSMLDDRGLPIEGDPQLLLFAPQLRWIVNEVLKSQLRSDTNSNAVNVVNQLGLRLVMTKYLTNTTDWFVLSSTQRHKLLFYWREDPVSDHMLDFETGNMKTKMTFRFSHGPADWRNIVGGNGT